MRHRVLVLCLLLADSPSLGLTGLIWSTAPQSARGRFIVAFELRAEGPEFVWPLDTFPPARQAAVLLVVEEMPRVRSEGGAESRTLPAPRHLQINGRLRAPRLQPPHGRAQASPEDEFVVELNEGRLRLSVTLPAGSQADAQHRTARIALYEVEPRGARRH